MADHFTSDPVLAESLAAEACFYGYPLVLSDITFIALAGRSPDGTAAYNRFHHMREFPDASFTDVVSPNVDTLYSIAILDLGEQPVTLSVPDMGDRYYLLPLLDSWTNVFASPGTRTTGNGPGKFCIAGPRWQGRVPEDAACIRSPTSRSALIGRTQTNGRQDYGAVRAVQDGYTLSVDPAYRPPKPPDYFDPATPPKYQVEKLSAGEFYKRLNNLLTKEFPAGADAPLLERLGAIGISAEREFDPEALPPPLWKAVERGYEKAKSILESDAPRSPLKGAWRQSRNDLGDYGIDYRFRAATAHYGWGANLTADSVYAGANTDDGGNPLSGAGNYVIRFAPDALPPVKAFWSITLYNGRQFLAANPLDRYALGDRDKLVRSGDGGLEIWVSRTPPENAPPENWLPAPEGTFNLIMRLYWPDERILNGTWPLPAIVPENREKRSGVYGGL
jgi:hypothetical protein